ncbi:alpha/beta hydrolase [Aspergillus mulundensis]|uniref:AB hydrolase-1 domain-containing protein n=1 Tax=Aspergillus mulundensis TaxID=1810919 RepID=A0A3D8S4T9_9EURO|nr:Uncharacterized protein DSM5745_04823 [Aspergillus mulundensis]RDW81266.1 Uncharacterized protein DSM5745_04823 [Aspergillus mulundensis]
MSQPTIVFSLGAWSTPAVFDAVRSRLNTFGFDSECPARPSVDGEPPLKTFEDDVASLRNVLTRLSEEGNDIVVVAHSYGGMVASSAVEGLAKEFGGRVIKVIYLAAFALDKGQSLLGLLGGNLLPWMKLEVSQSLPTPCLRLWYIYAVMSQGDYVHTDNSTIWHDLSPAEQELWAARARGTSRLVFSGENTYEPWRDISCAYIICEEDLALLLPLQEMLAEKVGGPERTFRLPGGHSPFLSIPDRMADLLVDIIKA